MVLTRYDAEQGGEARDVTTRRLRLLSAALTWLSPRAWFVEDEVASIQALVAPGATCIDVGAEYGLYTCTFAASAGPRGQVHSVEPLPGPRRFLSRLLRWAGASTVRVHGVALSSTAGSGTMSVPVRRRLPVHGRAFLTTGADGLGPNAEFSRQYDTEVAVTTLDGLVARAGLDRVDVVKIDVEGAELAVLHGARATLERCHPVLLLEVEDRHLGKYGVVPEDVVRHLARFGYAAHVWSARRWRPVTRVTGEHRNYLFTAGRTP